MRFSAIKFIVLGLASALTVACAKGPVLRADLSSKSPSHADDTALNSTSIADCANCNPNALADLNTFSRRQADVLQLVGDIKDSDQLDQYLDCYKKGEIYMRRYNLEYRQEIQTVSEAFQIPAAFLSCLAFDENKFASWTSPTGVRGMMQITQATLKDLSIRLQHKSKPGDELQWSTFIRKIQESMQQGHKLSPKELGDYRESLVSLREAKMDQMLQQDWDRYYDFLNQQRYAEYSNQHSRKGRFQPMAAPRRLTPAMVTYNPRLEFATAALYVKEIMLRFDWSYSGLPVAKHKNGWSQSGEPNISGLDFLTMVAGLYNWGPGTADTWLWGKKTLKSWYDQLAYLHRNGVVYVKANKSVSGESQTQNIDWKKTRKLRKKALEVEGEMSSVRNCMETDNWLPPGDPNSKTAQNLARLCHE